jgi:hypothetical protein
MRLILFFLGLPATISELCDWVGRHKEHLFQRLASLLPLAVSIPLSPSLLLLSLSLQLSLSPPESVSISFLFFPFLFFLSLPLHLLFFVVTISPPPRLQW